MSTDARLHLIILHEDELKTAARLIDRCVAIHAGGDKKDDEQFEAAAKAFTACRVALHGVKDDSTLMLLNVSQIKQGKLSHARARKREKEADND